MLNNEGQRELCYIVSIDAIEPIIGSDNCEAAVVGGWKVMIRKNTFKAGDLAVYFEIDSKVPEKEPFMFLQSKHFKIKTQKYTFGGKGNFISQGLLMPLNDFTDLFEYDVVNGMGWLYTYKAKPHIKESKDTIVNIHDGLTELLGVKYSVAEDNKRKSNSNKYTKMVSRHQKLFKENKLVKWLYQRKWGKELLFLFLGKKSDKRTWPDWVRRTDEERCLPGKIKVLTEQGYIPISKIVNQKMDIKVASMNNKGKIEYKKILNYQKFNNDSKVMTIKYPLRPDTKGRLTSIVCTPDHKLYTNRGYIEAKDLMLSDALYSPIECYNDDALEAIYGMLLGDSHIYNDKRTNGMLRVVATNGEKQLEYLKYKQQIFNGDGKIVNAGIGSFGRVPSYHWFLNVDASVSMNVRKDWYQDGKKQISDKVISKITPISLAFWYMDDGCLSYRNKEETAYFIRLNTQGFSYDEIDKLRLMLNQKFNIISKINKDKISSKGEWMYRLDISSTEESNKFLSLVAPYICDSMLYKLPLKFKTRELKSLSYNKEYQVLPVPIFSIENGQTKNKAWSKTFKTVYDLEIEDNHNFISEDIVVHNCQNLPQLFPGDNTEWIVTEKIDGSSTTFTMKGRGRREQYYICSRNVCFDKPEKNEKLFYDTNIYEEMAEKYDIQNKLRQILEEHKDWDFITIQGETFGPSVQKRNYNLQEREFNAFNLVYGTKENSYVRMNSIDMKILLDKYQIPSVPILDKHYKLPQTIEEMINYADGPSTIDGELREGVVLRTYDGINSFKAVSNQFLIKFKE